MLKCNKDCNVRRRRRSGRGGGGEIILLPNCTFTTHEQIIR